MFPVGALRRIEAESADEARASPRERASDRLPVVVWVQDGPVCVEIIDEAPAAPSGSVCRCGGCHASLPPDSAIDFL
jgi:hypothetical protein